MPRNTATHPRLKKTLLTLAISAALAPHGAWALDLAQSPPGSTEPYVAPNVIISIDDSGSMNFRVNETTANPASDTSITAPDPVTGIWNVTAPRINILRHSLKKVFNDTTLLPDKKIRVAWQSMWNNGKSSGAKNVDSASMNENSMRVLQGSHRTNFLSFVDKLKPSNGTPSHLMFSQADAYMRRDLSDNSPWAAIPGTTGAPFLGCRRNYHIMMTDGRWNGTASDVPDTSRRDNATNISLPDGTVYGGATAADRNKSQLYRDTFSNTLADWAFYSWAKPLQTTGLSGTVQPTSEYRQAPSTENFGKDTANKDAILDRFWNPRYNPATWAHMVTYTIGFSTDATTWPGANSIFAPTEKVPFGYDQSFPDLVTGTKKWPVMDNENRRALDLWHAALNGRGRFYAVNTGDDLEKAFREILGKINTQTDPDLGSNATSGSNNTRFDVGKYVAGYEPKSAWKGLITAETVKTDGTTEPAVGWNNKSTADKLDAITAANIGNRVILSWSDKWVTANYKGGVPFKWASTDSNLSNPQKLWLQKSIADVDGGATKGQQRLNFIRGDRTQEGAGTDDLRERKSIQGDIINSVVWYVGPPASSYPLKGYSAFTRDNRSRTPMIYVGGNDGMLHGFSTADGSEKIAYVPKGVIPALRYLTDASYNRTHKYFVDGSPMTGDVDLGTGVQDPADPAYDANYAPNWRTLLVGTLGAGGKGYFALDVTNPSATNTSAPANIPGFADNNAQQLVMLDRSRSLLDPVPNCALNGMSAAEKLACQTMKDEDDDIGHITAQPVVDDANPLLTTQITRLNNNRWAVVMGNGYNSKNTRPVLLIQYLDGDKELKLIRTTNDAAGTGKANDNGLAAPRLVDLNGDGRPDVVYAGDNLGNLWKFDITSLDANDWSVAFGGSPLFTATGPASLGSASRPKVQPITAAPTTRANDRTKTVGTGAAAKTSAVGGMMVAFGTGRNITQTDPESVDVQTLYSVLDNTRYRVVTTAKGKRLEVHPGEACSPPSAPPLCVPVPAPQALGSGVSGLAQQTVGAEQAGAGVNLGRTFATTSTTNVNFASQNGWYMDLPTIGERMLKPLGFFDGTNILTMYSQVPAKGSDVDPNIESCESTSVDEERQYLTLVNIMDGKRSTVPLMDLNGDGAFSAADGGVSRVSMTKGSHTLITQGKKIIDLDSKNKKIEFARMPEQSLRPSWRQLR